MSMESVMPSNHLILCCALLIPPSIFPNIRVFSNESALHITNIDRILMLQLLHQSFQETFRTDFLQDGLLSSPCCSRDSEESSTTQFKASILWCSAFFIVQLSHPLLTTGETIAMTRWTFVGKGMSLHFNMLSRLVKTFLPRSKCLLISWLQSPSV